jgi:hypothetical protein
MRYIRYEGFEALCVEEAQASTIADGLLWIALVGQTVSVRAIAAALLSVDCRQYSSGIMLDRSQVHLAKGDHYRVLFSQHTERTAHGVTARAVIMHQNFTAQAVNAHHLLFAQRDKNTVPHGFFRRLRMAVGLPMLPEWTDWLWFEGQSAVSVPSLVYRGHWAFADQQLIAPISAQGLEIFQVATELVGWAALIRRHFDLGLPEVATGALRLEYALGNGQRLRISQQAGRWRAYGPDDIVLAEGERQMDCVAALEGEQGIHLKGV